MEIERLPFGQSYADKIRAGHYKWVNMPPGLPPDMAGTIILGLRSGERTIAHYTRSTTEQLYLCSYARFQRHCALNPEWGAEAWRLSKATTNRLKSENSPRGNKAVCLAGLHEMSGDNVRHHSRTGWRYCAACRKVTDARVSNPLTEAGKQRIKDAFAKGATVSLVCYGKPIGGGQRDRAKKMTTPKILGHARANDSAFDLFISEHTANSTGRGQQIRWQKFRARLTRESAERDARDYFEIAAIIPRWVKEQDKFDIVNDVMMDFHVGKITRDQLRQSVLFHTGEENKLFATKFNKFGNAKLLSLDEVIFEDGSTTIGDTVSRGLWD
jgi:hypothetical protein